MVCPAVGQNDGLNVSTVLMTLDDATGGVKVGNLTPLRYVVTAASGDFASQDGVPWGDLSNVPSLVKFKVITGGGGATTENLNHGHNTANVFVLYSEGGATGSLSHTYVDDNNVTVSFAQAPTAGSVTYYVLGFV